MSKARNLADLLDANGDVALGNLDNVPPSNDASALTTGTLPIDRIADNAIGNSKIASGVDASKLTTGTIPAARIADGSIAAGKLDTVYQTPLTAGTDYLAPNGDGSGLNGIASDALIKDLSVASGSTISTRDALSLNSSGEIGEYPAINVLTGSTVTGSRTQGVGVADSSGTRFCSVWGETPNQNAGSTFPCYIAGSGYNPDTSTWTQGSTTTYNISIGNGSYLGGTNASGSAYPLRGTGKFIVFMQAGAYWAPCTHSSRSQVWVRLITVNADGSVTTHASYNLDSGTQCRDPGYGGSRGHKQITRHNYTIFVRTAYDQYRYNRSIHINSAETGWTITDEGTTNYDGIASYTAKAQDTLTANGYAVKPDTSFNYYTCTVSSNNISAQSSAQSYASQMQASYSSGHHYTFLGNSQKFIARYVDTTGAIRLYTGSVSDNGIITIIDEWLVPESEEVWYNAGSIQRTNSDTKVFAYYSGKLNTLELNADGTFKGYGITNYNNSAIHSFGVSSDDLAIYVYENTNGTDVKTLTINGWSTNTFKLAGFANENASSGTCATIVGGVVGGFTGLQAGKKYYVNTAYDGSIVPEGSATAGDLVGLAISSTELLSAGVN